MNWSNSIFIPFLKESVLFFYTKGIKLHSLDRPFNLFQSLHCSQFSQVRNLLRDCLEADIVRLTLKYLSMFGKSGSSLAKL